MRPPEDPRDRGEDRKRGKHEPGEPPCVEGADEDAVEDVGDGGDGQAACGDDERERRQTADSGFRAHRRWKCKARRGERSAENRPSDDAEAQAAIEDFAHGVRAAFGRPHGGGDEDLRGGRQRVEPVGSEVPDRHRDLICRERLGSQICGHGDLGQHDRAQAQGPDDERACLAQRRNDPAAGGHERRTLFAGDSRYLPGHPQAHSGLDDRRSGAGAGDAPAERIDEGVVDGDVRQSAGRRSVHRPLRVSETAKRARRGENEEHPRKAGRGCAKIAFGLCEGRCVRAEEPQDRLSEGEEDEGQPQADAQGEPHSLDSLPGRLAAPARSHELSGGRRRRVREEYAQAHDRRHDRRGKRQPRKRERAEVPDHRGVRGEQQRLGQQRGERRQCVCTNLAVEDPSTVG